MATPEESSDHGHSTTATSDSAAAPSGFDAIFSPDLLNSLRGVISVLLDIGRLIDKALAMWRDYGTPTLHHT